MEQIFSNLWQQIGGGPGVFRFVLFLVVLGIAWWILARLYGIFARAKGKSKSTLVGFGAVAAVIAAVVVFWLFAGDWTEQLATEPALHLPPRGEVVVVRANASKGVTFQDLVSPDQAVHLRVDHGKAKIYVNGRALLDGHPYPRTSDISIPPQGYPWQLGIKSAQSTKTTVIVERL